MGYRRSKLKKILQAPTEKIRYGVIDNLIPDELRDGRILDIGCGEYPYFLERIEFKSKYGIDPIIRNGFFLEYYKSKDIILNKGRAPDIFWSWMPNTFDVITIISVIEHFNPEDVLTIFDEIYRILKPGGRLIMTCLNPKASWFLHLIGWDIEHQKYYDIEIIGGMLEYVGFDGIQDGCFEFGLNRWLYAEKGR